MAGRDSKPLLRRHRDYMRRWKGNRQRLDTPCCGKRLTVSAPPAAGETWSSLMTCPHCGDLFMKLVKVDSALGLQPPQDVL